MKLHNRSNNVLRFQYENGHIVDRDTTEKLSTMEQAVEKLNQLNILIDLELTIDNDDESPDYLSD